MHAAAEVVDLAAGACALASRGHHGVDQIVHMEHVAHLEAVAVDVIGLAGEHGVEEVRDPALVFVAELPRTGDAGHAEDDGGQIVDAGIVADVLVGRTLGAAIGRVEVERLVLVDAAGSRRRRARSACPSTCTGTPSSEP